MEEERRVPIPSYAKHGKNGSIYAMERDVPYYQDEQNVKGHFVIGHECDEEGMMVPDWRYDMYCTEEAVKKKKRRALEQKKLKEEQEKKEQEEKKERERNLGWTYVPISECWEDMHCYPVNGYLAEKYFRESGLTEVLDHVLGKERSFWLRLSAALLATSSNSTFEYFLLNHYPMENHMVYEMNRYFTLRMWGRISDEEEKEILSAWLKKKTYRSVSAMEQTCKVTLYYDQNTDSYGDRFFGQRLRTGTRHDAHYMYYRNAETGELLAFERLKHSFDSFETPDGINTIHESDYPSLRKASLQFFLPSYSNYARDAMKKIQGMICMHASEYDDQKEMKKILKQLEETEEKNKRKIIRWDGELDGRKGHWILMEIPEKHEWMSEDAGSILQQHKHLLSAMSYLNASSDPWAYYFDIECQNEDEYELSFDDNVPFTVKLVKNAAALFRQDAGRYLYFTEEEPLTDQQLINLQWRQEDMMYQCSAFINQGETTDMTDEFFEAMPGRDLALFIAQSYREWIYDHAGSLFTEKYDAYQLAGDLYDYRCSIASDGSVKAEAFSKKLSSLMKAFAVTRKDLIEYVQKHASEKKYFSDEYLK